MDAALCRVSARGDVRAAQRLLALGASADAEPRMTNWLDPKPSSALWHAARGGHAAVVDVLLAAGAHVDLPDAESALAAACAGGHLAVVDRLLAAGADVNAEGGEPLARAARSGHLAVVDRLLRVVDPAQARPAGFEFTALKWACTNAHLDVVQRLDEIRRLEQSELDSALRTACGGGIGGKARSERPTQAVRLSLVDWLLARGANIYKLNYWTLAAAASTPALFERLLSVHRANTTVQLAENDALLWACSAGEVETVAGLTTNLLLGEDSGWMMRMEMLRMAAVAGQMAVLEKLLRIGDGVFDHEANVLEAAVWAGNADFVDQLLQHQLCAQFAPSPSAVVSRLLTTPDEGSAHRNALCRAAEDGNLAVADRLLATSGFVDAMADAIALWIACAEGHTAVVRRLLDFGMDPNVRNTELADHRTGSYWLEGDGDMPSGEPAIVAASSGGYEDVVKLLLAHGAGVSAHAPFRETPLMVACEHGHVGIVEQLLAAGADVHAPDDAVRHVIAFYGDAYRTEPLQLLQEPPAIEAATVFADGSEAARDAPIRLASEGGHVALVLLLLHHGANPARISWDDLAETAWPAVAAAVPRATFGALPDDVKPVWLRYHVWFKHRLRPRLSRARDRLDRPPQATEPLGPGTPTRERLIAHLRTAGRRFAREYWTDGLPIFFPSVCAELGPVPDEFLFTFK